MIGISKRLDNFYNHRSTAEIAKDMLGRSLIYSGPNGRISGLIVETEAYLGENDSAAHAFKGRRVPSNEPLYGLPGTVYIYAMRGLYCFDVVTQSRNVPQGVLVRAVEPIEGIDMMMKNRTKHSFDLTNGPGKLMQAYGINNKDLNFRPTDVPPLWIDLANQHRKVPVNIVSTPRIGVSDGEQSSAPLRFYVDGNPYVSKLRKRDRRADNGWR